MSSFKKNDFSIIIKYESHEKIKDWITKEKKEKR